MNMPKPGTVATPQNSYQDSRTYRYPIPTRCYLRRRPGRLLNGSRGCANDQAARTHRIRLTQIFDPEQPPSSAPALECEAVAPSDPTAVSRPATSRWCTAREPVRLRPLQQRDHR